MLLLHGSMWVLPLSLCSRSCACSRHSQLPRPLTQQVHKPSHPAMPQQKLQAQQMLVAASILAAADAHTLRHHLTPPRCLPACLQEVLLRQELPLQQVLMAATMSRVQQLALPGGGALRCEVALSHPQHGSSLLVGCHGSGGEGLQVTDQEENEVMSVQVGGSSAVVQAVWQHAGAAGW